MSEHDELLQRIDGLERALEGQRHVHDQLAKAVDDLMWYQLLGPLAEVDKVMLTGPAPRYQPNPTAQGAGNPLVFHAYSFVPHGLDHTRSQPLVVYAHGGVHANFSTGAAHIIRELVTQGYCVVAPDYRGSTGYGGEFFHRIDYGGLESEDTFAAREWMLQTHSFLDPARVGIVGWSHGGMHALFNIFDHPDAYACAFAGVPSSDLIARMAYKGPAYQAIFAAPSHIGKTAAEDVAEYRRRSPAWNAEKLRTPLLIHTNTTDEDVNVIEVLHLIQALKAEGKSFEYEVFQAEAGGHRFDRLDTPRARQIRSGIYRFLSRYLTPAHPPE